MQGKVRVFFKFTRNGQAKAGPTQITTTEWETFDYTDIVHDSDRVIIYNDGKLVAEFSTSVFERLFVVEQPEKA